MSLNLCNPIRIVLENVKKLIINKRWEGGREEKEENSEGQRKHWGGGMPICSTDVNSLQGTKKSQPITQWDKPLSLIILKVNNNIF